MAFLQRTMNRGSVSTGYNIDNSLKLEQDNTEYLHKTPGSSGNRRTFTLSGWIKRTEVNRGSGGGDYIFTAGDGDYNQSDRTILKFNHDDTIYWGGGSAYELKTNRVFRDTSAWYHIAMIVDTTSGTAGDRLKLYVNGVRETSFSSSSNPSQNFDYAFMKDDKQVIGYNHTDSSNPASMYIAEVIWLDGTAASITDLGEFDEDTGIWIPKDVSDLSVGTNGCYLDFEDSSNLGNDASGGTDFTLNNIAAADQATDTPTNNFCIVNNNTRQGNQYGGYTTSQQATNGGTVIVEPTGSFGQISGTIGVGAGKWYWEMKPVGMVGFSTAGQIYGITSPVNLGGSESRSEIRPGATTAKDTSAQYAIYPMYTDQSRSYRGDSDSSANWTSSDEGAANNVIWRIALDLDNGKIWYGRNNVWLPDKDTDIASNPSTGSNARDTDLLGTTRLVGGFYLPSFGMYNENSGHTIQTNFGGYSVISNSKSYSDANGYGAFVYAVPTGFYSICSKNLAEYGG